MKLHDNQQLFQELTNQTSAYYGLQNFQVEKDYYVSLLLKTLVSLSPDIVFKGGTSLSKCYDVIKRFSEDIDLNVELKPGQSKVPVITRRKLKSDILSSIQSLDFSLLNPDSIYSKRDFNLYEVSYNNVYPSDNEMIKHIIVETNVAHRVFPCEELEVSNYITKFVRSSDGSTEDKQRFFEEYEMFPFICKVQTVNRTFIDKLFAICDYYEKGTSHRFSRHLYDVHKIWISGLISHNNLKEILPEIIEIRQKGREVDTISCRPGYKLRDKFEEVIQSDFFKNDYTTNTEKFLFEEVSYEEVISTLQSILTSGILPNVIESE